MTIHRQDKPPTVYSIYSILSQEILGKIWRIFVARRIVIAWWIVGIRIQLPQNKCTQLLLQLPQQDHMR